MTEENLRIQDSFAVPPPPLVYARWRDPLPPSQTQRPALFLDRDGVINVDTGYLHRVDDLVIRDGIATRIANARRAGQEVVIVTNQSGIGRGYFDWAAFETLHAEIDHRLTKEDADAQISLLLAAPFHPEARPPYAVDKHPWRKPNPGMLLFAAKALNLSLADSLMLGDATSDAAAARSASVKFEMV